MCFCNWLYFTFCSYLNLIFYRFYRVLVALMFGLILLVSPMPPLLLAKSCCSPLLDGVKTFTLKVFKTFCLNWAYKFLLLLFLLSASIAFPLEKIVSSINACSAIFRSRSTCKLQKDFIRQLFVLYRVRVIFNDNIQVSKMSVQVKDMATCSGKIYAQVKYVFR